MNIKNTLFLLLMIQTSVWSQFISEQDTLYGNEWIEFDQQYFKISIAEDGIYRIPLTALSGAGIPVDEIGAANYQLIFQGKPYPLYIVENEYIEFYGRKNRGALDRYLYENPETMQLNPEYSNFNDTSAYFLTWSDAEDNSRPTTVVTDLSENTLAPETFFMHRQQVIRNNAHIKPTRGGSANVRYSHFDIGEGFASGLAKRNNIAVPAVNIFSAGPDPTADIRFTTNVTAHSINLSVNDEVFENMEFTGYQLVQKRLSFPLSLLKANNTITVEGQIDNFDRNAVAVVTLSYPRTFNMGNAAYFEMNIAAHDAPKYFDLQNFNSGSETIIYDPALNQRILPEVSGGRVKFILAPHNQDRTIIIFNGTSGVRQPSKIEEVTFRDYSQMDHDYIIISHPRLSEGPEDQVAAYADYRASAQGGGYRSVVINVETLYDQFAYGINRHSHGVKNFVNYIAKIWSAPKYVFIIGKGREYAVYRTPAQITDPQNADFSVPTYGYPGSDNMLLSRDASSFQIITGGRIPAKNAQDVNNYLSKIIEYESNYNADQTKEDKAWMKKIIHLSGGDAYIQDGIFARLENMREEIESNKFGANVYTYRKYTTDVLQTSISNEITGHIDDGAAIITFFGHSAVGRFDFSLEDPSQYENRGKYPIILSLGCFSGNIHTKEFSLGEDFVMEPNRAAIGFIASSSTAYISPQANAGFNIYSYIGNEMYGKSIGEIINKYLKSKDSSFELSVKSLNQQITLNGDPALTIYHHPGPDLILDNNSYVLNPGVINPNDKTFEFSFDVLNIGSTIHDSFNIEITHIGPNELPFKTYNLAAAINGFSTKITVQLDQPGISYIGKNQLKISLDADNDIVELPVGAENNNEISLSNGNDYFEFYIFDNSAIPIFPGPYGILNDSMTFELKASTHNAFLENQLFIFEIDTTQNFNSPSLERGEVSSRGGIITYTPSSISLNENQVYYWRVSPDSINQVGGANWSNSSFVYLSQSGQGWNQSHFFQFLENNLETIKLNDSREFELASTVKDIRFDLGVKTVPGQWIYVDGVPWGSLNPKNLGSFVGVFITNPETLLYFNTSDYPYGGLKTSIDLFGYDLGIEEHRQDFVELIESTPFNSRIFIYSIMLDSLADFKTNEWSNDNFGNGKNIFSVLEQYGVRSVNALDTLGTVPFLVIFDKEDGLVYEEYGENKNSQIETSAIAYWKLDEGKFNTVDIGPAKSWSSLEWQKSTDTDDCFLRLYGLDQNKIKSLLIDSILINDLPLNQIDAEAFPFINIECYCISPETRIIPNIEKLRVLFTGYPDIGIAMDDRFLFEDDTLWQGQTLRLQVPFSNTSYYDIDSVSSTVVLRDNQNNTFVFEKQLQPVLSQGSALVSYEIETFEFAGDYELAFELNAEKQPLEVNYFNNVGIIPVHIKVDKSPPLVDVLFDGAPIMDGDIVSAQTNILISIKDENKFLLLNDPDDFLIKIISPSGIEKDYTSANSEVTFVLPENENNNLLKIDFTPSFEENGIHKLIFQSSDRSGNSQKLDYAINFTIALESSVSNVLNYPNPFSTSTEFVFTLTGSEVPETFTINIYTISGKLVKQIFKEELGPLRIGLNRTSYKWDGRDDFGNLLANGVYLYHVKVQNDQMEKYETFTSEIDTYFKNGMGKLVILR